jgi:hypothetical protein
MDPDAANTSSLENVVALCPGITRNPATFSSVSANLELSNGNYPANTLIAHVSGDTTARFANIAPVTQAASPAVVSSVIFQSQTAGAIEAALGTLNQIAEPVSGWSSITNTIDATVGDNVETDTELRRRREQQLALSGGSSVMGIRADVINIGGVDRANVRENSTDATVSSLPPHSFQVIYQPESGFTVSAVDAQVAQAIHDSKPAGIATYGSISAVISDSGSDITILFDRFTEVDVYFDIVITNYANLSAEQNTAIENAVIAAIGSNPTIYKSTFTCAVTDLLETYNVTITDYNDQYYLTSLKMDTHDAPDDNVSLTTTVTQIFTTDSTKIDLA